MARSRATTLRTQCSGPFFVFKLLKFKVNSLTGESHNSDNTLRIGQSDKPGSETVLGPRIRCSYSHENKVYSLEVGE